MFKLLRRSVLNPVTRTAIITFAWANRHEVFRWGRSLWDQTRRDIDPAAALRTGRVLFAIASHADLRNAQELRKVTMTDGAVDLDVDAGWSALPQLLDRVRSVSGVTSVTVNGNTVGGNATVADVTAPRSLPYS